MAVLIAVLNSILRALAVLGFACGASPVLGFAFSGQDLRALAGSAFRAMAAALAIMGAFGASLSLGDEISVIDARGRTVVLEREPKRVAALSFASLELIRLMNGADRLVGASRQPASRLAIVPEMTRLASLGGAYEPDMEALVGAKPELVVAWGSFPGLWLEDRLKPFGISVLRLDFYHPGEFEREVAVLAEVLGPEAERRAKEYLAWNRGARERLEGRVSAAKDRPSVVVEHFSRNRVAGPGSGAYDLTLALGARNLGAELGVEASDVDPEWILSRDPSMIVKMATAASYGSIEDRERHFEALRQDLSGRPGWEALSAVRNGRLHVMDSDLSAGPRQAVGLHQLARWLYPELVGKDEAGEVWREYLRVFQGIEPDRQEP